MAMGRMWSCDVDSGGGVRKPAAGEKIVATAAVYFL